jgi:hypothetical protein
METFLGLVGFVIYIACVIGAAAAVTWLVVKLSPSRNAETQKS